MNHLISKKLGCLAVLSFSLGSILLSAQSLPDQAPRTWILPDQDAVFKEFCLTGAGAENYALIKADFDELWLDSPFPEEPQKYGDPDPRKRTSAKADLWRDAQDTCGQVASVAATSALLWRVTGEDKYFEKAREFILKAAAWDNAGATDIFYNDEAHFRLWRKLPMAYDQIRTQLSEEDRSKIIPSFALRGERSAFWIKKSRTATLKKNSLEVIPSSHPVRFMAMTGMSGLALYDDIPEARSWFNFAYTWYKESFTPWGGDDGGWAEGVAYWRGVYEHAIFQDALLLLGDSEAYSTPFWKNTGYYQVYFTQPYGATQFGDLSRSGKFNMEPNVKHFMDHLGRVTGNGDFISWAAQYNDPEKLPTEKGLKEIDREYPTSTEYLIRDFIASRLPEVKATNLADLPGSRYFKDIGWVGMHSALGDPENDIHLSFKSSPYGSISHSHADQNAFILNAWGKGLAINSGYREFHRSMQHKYYTRETKSKNAVLIDLRGQAVQNENSTGKITNYESGERYSRATGEAATAYQFLQPRIKINQAQRDIIFIDKRYFIIRDIIKTSKPTMATWMLHAVNPMSVDTDSQKVLIENDGVYLATQLTSSEGQFGFRQWHKFEIPVDPKYADENHPDFPSYLTEANVEQSHLAADSVNFSESFTIDAVLWPTKNSEDLEALSIKTEGDTVIVTRPDGGIDKISISTTGVRID
ncbi:MAG: heparinase II/III domain-containing protein [Opitutaceae bacterium]